MLSNARVDRTARNELTTALMGGEGAEDYEGARLATWVDALVRPVVTGRAPAGRCTTD